MVAIFFAVKYCQLLKKDAVSVCQKLLDTVFISISKHVNITAASELILTPGSPITWRHRYGRGLL
jgi:hypothetical protein